MVTAKWDHVLEFSITCDRNARLESVAGNLSRRITALEGGEWLIDIPYLIRFNSRRYLVLWYPLS